MDRPKTHYAKSPDGHVAYQTVGKGPPDIVLVAPYFTHVEAMWEVSQCAPYLRGLAQIGRLVVFDTLGSGLSDPMPERKRTLDAWTGDLLAVMETLRIDRAVIHGFDTSGAMAVWYAASFPQNVTALVLIDTFSRALWAEDYPHGLPTEMKEAFVDEYMAEWGTGEHLRGHMPTAELADAEIERWGWFERQVASPGASRAGMELAVQSDVRQALPLIQSPTLVVHRRDNPRIPVELGRYMGERIPGAKYVEMEGNEHILYGTDGDALLAEIREFITGMREAPVTDRVLATILFTDIVSSTERAAKLGDRRWRELLDEHDRAVSAAVERFSGRVVKTTGDGALATFDGPARAIEAARAIMRAVGELGLPIRAGLHAGECEIRGDDVGGIAVHIASRIADLAGSGDVLVSRTVKDLTVGSGIAYADRGDHELKGVPEPWQLFQVT